jgi:hypothetical protein
MNKILAAIFALLMISSCAEPKLAVSAKLEGKVEAPRNQNELNDVRLAMYISDYISAHGKVFNDADYGTYTLKFLVFDAQTLALQNIEEQASPAMKSYLKRLFAQKQFKPPLNANYKLGEFISVRVRLEHN